MLTNRCSANVGSIIIDMTTTFNAMGELVTSETNPFSATETLWARVKRSRWAIGHSLFRCRRRLKQRFPILTGRSILPAGEEGQIAHYGAFI